METTKKFLKRVATHTDIVLIVYAIKRWNSIPSKYNKIIYAGILSPIMLTLAWLYTDRIASRYRHFLVKFCFPEVKHITGNVYEDCSSHKKFAEVSFSSSCWDLFKKNAPVTIKNVAKLYLRFYVLQMVIVSIVKRKFELKQIKSTALNVARSTAFLAGQTISMRVSLCVAHAMGLKFTKVKMWLLCYLCSLCILFERADRVGQINNLVFAHVLIGWLKKQQLLSPTLTLPVFLSTLLKDKGKVDPVTALIAMGSIVVF